MRNNSHILFYYYYIMFIKIMSMASILSLGVTGTAVVTAEPQSSLYPVKTEIQQALNIDSQTSTGTKASTTNNSQGFIQGSLKIWN